MVLEAAKNTRSVSCCTAAVCRHYLAAMQFMLRTNTEVHFFDPSSTTHNTPVVVEHAYHGIASQRQARGKQIPGLG